MDDNPDWNEANVFEILPETYKAHLTSFRPYLRGYNAILRLNITNKIEAEDWLKDFSEKSLTNYRVDRTFPENTPKVLFKKEYRCLHANKPGSPKIKTPHSKHSACRAKLTITIKQRGMKRSKDKYLKDYPCEVMLRYIHNHPVAFKDAVKSKPSKEAQESILDLFSKGHSPTTALEAYKEQLREEHGDDYLKMIEDPEHCPTQKWCYSLYYNTYKRKHLVSDDSEAVDKDQADDGGEDDDDSASLTD